MADDPLFVACRSCGRWFRLAAPGAPELCSPACRERWALCRVCGRAYALTGDGAEDPGVCSPECGASPSEWDFVFKNLVEDEP